MLREISIRVVIQYSINGRFSSDRYQKVARPLTGSMGFGFIFQSPDTLPDIKKMPFSSYFSSFLATVYTLLLSKYSELKCSVG